ncbi:MAG TPA: response regulator [Aggregicoccus sp.]|nr:response regulator [Aggregicoccus sp.]
MEAGRDILVVEPYAPLRQALVLLLESEGYSVRATGSAAEALASVDERLPALVLFGAKHPLREGRDFLDQLGQRRLLRQVPVVLLSPRPQWPEGAADLLEMPCSPDVLRRTIARHAGWAAGGHGRGAGAH